MKRSCVIKIAVCLGCLMTAGGAFAEEFDLRGIRWGMNRFEVMASERLAPKRMRPDEILYRISLFNRPTHLMYRFYEDRLVGARYVLPVKAADTLDKLENLVSLRYGKATKEATAVGESRVWVESDRTIRLFIAKKGQAVIDVASKRIEAIPAKEVALLQRHARKTVANSF